MGHSRSVRLSEFPADRPWTEVISLRRRGFKSMLALTLLASLGGWVWLGPVVAFGWAAGVPGLMGLNRLVWAWIERPPRAIAAEDQAMAPA